ncbi:cation channel family protein (macronuclear) [Tetrahymena thermophila SB210]|uniref:Cation channel family protein n=1 Tax=Tetrahymena thermophila (strain SB210) TaxID=312017 RepID=Q23R02_TETTS|nr:cation channel family protein [Tetrahymena thermophila SB210]EAR98954.3 cation channel family protein [Tetrahymena thermophila SB210]|eukprot:XP_001019199.3 cation channel family protein [Tetrahymena thermophila SB210]
MQENQKTEENQIYNQNGKVNKQNQDLPKVIHIEKFDLHYHNIASNITSTQKKIEIKQLEGEENYESGRDFNEKLDFNSISQQMSASQQELMMLQTERQNQNSLLPLNSTINPKINLYEKQLENTKMETYYEKRNSNLLKQQVKFAFEQSRVRQNSEIKPDIIVEDSNKIVEDYKQKKMGNTVNQKRNSSKMQAEQFQINLQKVIQIKNNQYKEHKDKYFDNFDKEESMQTQELETSYNNQIQDPYQQDQQQKFDKIQKLIKKEGQLSNSFVARLIIQIPVFNPFNFAVIGLELTRFPFCFQITKLIFLVFLLAHINGCIFNQVAKNLDESWLTKNNINNADWYVRYINSVYFSFISMVTVGYGDITPISLQEKIFVIFMVAYSCGVFGYIVSSIGNIFTERAQVKAKFKSQLVDIIQYMRTRNIDQIIQSQVYKYLDYLEKMDHYNHQKGEFTVQKLSPYLQKQIKINSYYPFLKKINYFKLNFKDSILVSASLKIKEITFGPGQIIFNQNDYDNRLYFILKGEVQLSNNNHKICIKDENDNCFGINEFFTGEARNLQAKSLTVSQILYLELSDFKEILKEDPLEYEKFSSLKDQAIFSKVSIDQSCYFCNKFSHMHDLCPFYTIKNQRLLIIERSKRNIDQLRQKFERPYLQKFNSLLKNQIVRLNLKAVRLNYINNLAVDKYEIIQLVQNNTNIENDLDFYRQNDAFEYRKSLDAEGEEAMDLKQNIVLISSDKIAEEFFQDEEILEKSQETQESNFFFNSSKKIARSSILAVENFIDEQKNIQQFPFISSNNHQAKRNSYLKSCIFHQNNNAFERLTSIKEHISQKNINIQNSQDLSQKKIPEQSENLNQNMNNNQHLLNQIFNFIEQKKGKYNSDNCVDIQNINKSDDFFIVCNFDLMQEFTRYFPKNNLHIVLQKYNKLCQKQLKLKTKKSKKLINRSKNTLKQSKIQQALYKYQAINILQQRNSNLNQIRQSSVNINDNLKLELEEGTQNLNSDSQSEYQLTHMKQVDTIKSNFSNSQQ